VPCKDSSPPLSCFADPTYEKRTAAWKRYDRDGKPPVEAARTFAANWLREIEQR